MIFTRIRMWGNLSKLGLWEKNTHVSSFPCLTQPLSLKNCCWWLRQLIVFGSGVAGLPVLTHMHTPPWLTSLWLGKKWLPSLTLGFSTLPMTVQKCSPTCNSRPLHCCAFSRRGILSRFSSSRTELSGFYPRSFFPRGFADDVVVSTPHRLIVHSALLLTLIHRLGDCNFFPNVVCICFLGDLVPRTGCVFPCHWLWLLWSSLHVGNCCKFTWESFWPR